MIDTLRLTAEEAAGLLESGEVSGDELAGAYVEAHLRVHGDPGAARALLAPFEDHLRDAGLGTISEILEGDPPHEPRGCIAQAWGVAEVLRAWRLVEDALSSGG